MKNGKELNDLATSAVISSFVFFVLSFVFVVLLDSTFKGSTKHIKGRHKEHDGAAWEVLM